MSIRRREDGEDYLRQYPRFQHWIVTCMACGRRGHKPEMPPNDAPHFHGQNLRQFFEPLTLDSAGLCEQCNGHTGKPGLPTNDAARET